MTLGLLSEGVRAYALDPKNAEALWKKSEEMVGESFARKVSRRKVTPAHSAFTLKASLVPPLSRTTLPMDCRSDECVLQVQSRQPCSEQAPHVRRSCLRRAPRARWIRTPAFDAESLCCCSEILQTLLSEIDGAEDLGILRLEPVYDPMQARAHLVVKVWGWLGRGLQLTCPGLKSFIRGLPSPVTIDHRIAEQTVEPGYGRFAWLEVVLVLKSAEVRGLENVFGKLRVRDTALHEGEKLSLLSKQLIERCFSHRDSQGGRLQPPTLFIVGND